MKGGVCPLPSLLIFNGNLALRKAINNPAVQEEILVLSGKFRLLPDFNGFASLYIGIASGSWVLPKEIFILVRSSPEAS